MDEKLIMLEANDKSKDREIKDIKDEIKLIITRLTTLELTNQTVLNELKHISKDIQDINKNVVDEMKPMKDYIEQLKMQPQKDKDKFIWAIITIVLSAVGVAIGAYLKK